MTVREDDEVHNYASWSQASSSSHFPPPTTTTTTTTTANYYRPTSDHYNNYRYHSLPPGGSPPPPPLGHQLLRQPRKLTSLLVIITTITLVYFLHHHLLHRPLQPNSHFGAVPLPLLPNDEGPPPSTYTSSSSSSNTLPILDPTIPPPRSLRPSYPDPWADLAPSWRGREWLSPSRFPSSSSDSDSHSSSAGMNDPPPHWPPPAAYLSRAMEFTAAAARHLVTGTGTTTKKQGGISLGGQKQQPLPRFEERTGRPKLVDHAEVYLMQGGWKSSSSGAAVKVSEIRGGEMPRVQWEGFDQEQEEGRGGDDEEEGERTRRRGWVKRAFLHAWEGYKKHAWGHDEVMPLSELFSNNYNGWGATIVDNLDTLLLLNLSHEYNLARQHVAAIDFTYLVPSGALTFSTELPDLKDLDLPPDHDDGQGGAGGGGGSPAEQKARFVNPRLAQAMNQHSPTTIPHFETTIRYLGGLLSAYDLSLDPLMLARARELGDWLLPALGTKHGLAINRYVLGSNPGGLNSGRATLSEVGSLTLEFTRLSMVTGDEIYYQAVQRAMDTLDRAFPDEKPPVEEGQPNRGRLGTLLPTMVDPSRPDLMGGEYTFGGLSDSYYEYLVKQAQLVSDELPQYSRMYHEAIDSAHRYLLKEIEVVPGRKGMMSLGSSTWGVYKYSVEHLTCFAGGMLSLGSRLLQREKDLSTGLAVTEACTWAYTSTKTGLAPESLTLYHPTDSARYVTVDTPAGPARTPRGSPVLGVKQSNPRFIGRPETIESVFYQWRITGDRKWQDVGWQMFTSWVEHSITESGFASLNNVHLSAPKREDSQESFVLAETLKYYYLLFSPPDLISLDDYVFNTEAHPFRIPKAATADSTPPLFWTGPDESSPSVADFASTMGDGTWVQKWARVRQAAGLLHPSKATHSGTVPGGEPVKARPPIRPKEEELAAAAAKEVRPAQEEEDDVPALDEDLKKALEVKKKQQDQRFAAGGGGGRGMGGGAPPPRPKGN